jgi:uncharacterized protein
MASTVYFTNARVEKRQGLYQKLEALFHQSGAAKSFSSGDVVAIKMHFGELGNTRHLRPLYAGLLVKLIKEAGGKPFLTDSCVMYTGSRRDFFDHLETARIHGFTPEVVGCPIIIADGWRQNHVAYKVENHFKLEEVWISQALHDADALISLAHLTLHDMFPIAAAIKNLGMGGVPRKSKVDMHKASGPDKFAAVWEATSDGAGAIVRKFGDKQFYFNLCIDISPKCDCYPWADNPIAPDLGIFAGTDPIAVDKATSDALDAAAGLAGSQLSDLQRLDPGTDKSFALNKRINSEVYWELMKKTGLGNIEYELSHLVIDHDSEEND